MAQADGSALDECLETLDGCAPEYAGGFADHGPMVVEALDVLGLGERARAWAVRYRQRLEPAWERSERIDPARWREAAGQARRFPDWEALFEECLREAPWRDVVGEWAVRLLPGLPGAATHGAIRTAHAARALDRSQTDVRLREMARGLAFWAASYMEMAGTPRPSGALAVEEALRAVPRLGEERETVFFIDDRLRLLAGAFAAGVDALRPPASPEAVGPALSEVTSVFARAYLTNPQAPIAFVHTVTAPAAARLLLPYLPVEAHLDVLAYAWQAAAGIHAAFAEADPVPAAEVEPPEVSWDDLAARALEGRDEHAIKMVEACRREDALASSPGLLAAAADVATRLRD